MKKNKNNKIVILTIVMIILGIILGIKVIQKNNKDTNRTNEKKESNIQLTSREIQDYMTELKEIVNDKTDKTIVIVNGERISEREIAYIDFQVNNSYSNKTNKKKEAVIEAVKQCVIVQDAKEKEINLTDKKLKSIKERVNKDFKKGSKETNSFLDIFNMDYDDFISFYIKRSEKEETITLWTVNTINEISNGKLCIEYKDFKQQYNKYESSTDISERYQILLNLRQLYTEYLLDKAVIKYIN